MWWRWMPVSGLKNEKTRLYFYTGGSGFAATLFICRPVYEWYHAFNAAHGMIMSFLKFAVLSTLGEMIGLRISAGVYCRKGFGVLPRMFVWGILGMGINMAMVIFRMVLRHFAIPWHAGGSGGFSCTGIVLG